MKFETIEVAGLETALRGMRNPMDSWEKGDSGWGCYDWDSEFCKSYTKEQPCCNVEYVVGNNDMKLAVKLVKAGTEHRKFLRQIYVGVDITAPRYWWAEFDTYKIGTTANSCSTMHTLSKTPITRDMFAFDDTGMVMDDCTYTVVEILELLRKLYVTTENYGYFRLIKQLLPEGFLQKRTVSLNYETILTMYNQRKNHRLTEWSEDFVKWAESLPYFKELCIDN